MVFKRRDPRTLWRRFVAFVLPKRGYTRGWKYIGRRVQRIRDTPEKIALGFACGALASFTPLFGLHFFVAAFFAWILRANVVAGLFGTIVGNPLTFPFIATASIGVGRFLMGGSGQNVDGEGVLSAFGDVAALLWNALLSSLGFHVDNAVSWAVTKVRFHDFWDQVMIPYFAGGVFSGLIVATICYFLFRPAIAAYQNRRREKLALKKNSDGAKKVNSGKKASVS